MSGNVADLIAASAVADPGRTAILHRGRQWTFGELMERADAIAARLRAILAEDFPLALAPRIGLFCPNGADYVTLALGILRAGACLVPVASELTASERAEQVATTAQNLVVAAGPQPWLPDVGTSEECGGAVWRWTRTATKAAFPEERFAALKPAFVRFSSGTTGDSKGVVLGHETLLARVRSANRRLGITSEDRILWTLPMAHHFAVSIVLYLLHGATTVLDDSHLAADVLTTARSAGATVIYGSPFHHALLAAEESGRDWPTLRLAVSTAAPLAAETARAFHHRYGIPLSQAFGIIEAGLPLVNTAAGAEKPLSVGRPDDFEVRLLGENGEAVAVGEVGELSLRGPGTFDAYLSPWRERTEVAPDGWFATGDLALQGAEGDLFLRGRSKSVINVGGMKFFPEEVEAVLDRHPAVRASRVAGEAHERWGMIAVAQIVPQDADRPPTGPELARHCRERLSSYKVPVRFQNAAELPRTASGKLKR